MTPDEAAQLMYEHWLVMPLTNEEKRAVRALCTALNLPDPAVNKAQRVISSGPRRVVSTHPWGEPEALAGNDYR